jgi:hypothetical protein
MESGSQGGTRSYTFKNNLIVNMSPTATYQEADNRYIKSRIIEHNLFFGIHPATEPSDPFKVTGDPELKDPGNAGTGIESAAAAYQIQPGSAALERGTIIEGNGGTDFLGNTLYHREPDIGAHEYSGPVTTGEHDPAPGQEPEISILPNPMSERVAISFHLAASGPVLLEILDSLGRTVFSQTSHFYPSGTHRVYWEGKGLDNKILPNGLYICNITINGPAEPQLFSRGIVIQR